MLKPTSCHFHRWGPSEKRCLKLFTEKVWPRFCFCLQHLFSREGRIRFVLKQIKRCWKHLRVEQSHSFSSLPIFNLCVYFKNKTNFYPNVWPTGGGGNYVVCLGLVHCKPYEIVLLFHLSLTNLKIDGGAALEELVLPVGSLLSSEDLCNQLEWRKRQIYLADRLANFKPAQAWL